MVTSEELLERAEGSLEQGRSDFTEWMNFASEQKEAEVVMQFLESISASLLVLARSRRAE